MTRTKAMQGVLAMSALAMGLALATAAEAGQRSWSKSWTGPKGGTVEKSWLRGDGMAERCVERDGPNGWGNSGCKSAVRNDDGSVTFGRAFTDRFGETHSGSQTWTRVE